MTFFPFYDPVHPQAYLSQEAFESLNCVFYSSQSTQNSRPAFTTLPAVSLVNCVGSVEFDFSLFEIDSQNRTT